MTEPETSVLATVHCAAERLLTGSVQDTYRTFLLMPFDVVRRCAKQDRIILEVSEPLIAVVAEQVAATPGLVVMVGMQPAGRLDSIRFWRLTAHHALTILRGQRGLVQLQRPVVPRELLLPVIFAHTVDLSRCRTTPLILPVLELLRLAGVILPFPGTRKPPVALSRARVLVPPVRLEPLTALGVSTVTRLQSFRRVLSSYHAPILGDRCIFYWVAPW